MVEVLMASESVSLSLLFSLTRVAALVGPEGGLHMYPALDCCIRYALHYRRYEEDPNADR